MTILRLRAEDVAARLVQLRADLETAGLPVESIDVIPNPNDDAGPTPRVVPLRLRRPPRLPSLFDHESDDAA